MCAKSDSRGSGWDFKTLSTVNEISTFFLLSCTNPNETRSELNVLRREISNVEGFYARH